MYKIKDIAALASVSTRTLRHYDKIGLLSPSQRDSNGYRYYDTNAVNTLQHILFYKELGYPLDKINLILNSESFNRLDSLYEHLALLSSRKDHIENVMDLVMETISSIEGGKEMSDKQKFEAFKKEQIKQNSDKYGEELNQKYDPEFIKKSNERYMKKSKYEIKIQEELTQKLNVTIIEAMETKEPSGEKAQEMCGLHKEWLCFYWPSYDKEHHLSLVEMYTLDDRFIEYYNKIKVGAAHFLLESMKVFIKN